MHTPPLTRTSDPDTSREAARKIASSLNAKQQLVFEYIRSRGASGCTDLAIQHRFGNHGSTYRTRRAELVACGLVKDSGIRIEQDGGRRIVWIAAEYAAERAA